MGLSKVYLHCTKNEVCPNPQFPVDLVTFTVDSVTKKLVTEKFIFCVVLNLTFFTEKMKKDITAHQHDQSIDIRQKSGRITCQFRGDGTYNVLWNRVNNTKLREGIIENKTTLIFNDVQFNDTGTYQCTVIGPKNTATAKIDLEVYGKLFYYSFIFCYSYCYLFIVMT